MNKYKSLKGAIVENYFKYLSIFLVDTVIKTNTSAEI